MNYMRLGTVSRRYQRRANNEVYHEDSNHCGCADDLVGSVSAAPSYPAEVSEWLKTAKVGPFQETEIDYDRVYQDARRKASS